MATNPDKSELEQLALDVRSILEHLTRPDLPRHLPDVPAPPMPELPHVPNMCSVPPLHEHHAEHAAPLPSEQPRELHPLASMLLQALPYETHAPAQAILERLNGRRLALVVIATTLTAMHWGYIPTPEPIKAMLIYIKSAPSEIQQCNPLPLPKG